jgi:hypothetical protein
MPFVEYFVSFKGTLLNDATGERFRYYALRDFGSSS